MFFFFFFSSRRRHTRLQGDWSSDVCSSDLIVIVARHACFDRRVLRLIWAQERVGNGRQAGLQRIDHLLPIQRMEERSSDRKSTRLNSSHLVISYAVFCLKKKNSYL